MPDHVPSNFATYQKANGEPVFDTHFLMMEISGSFQLFAFATEEERKAALAVQLERRKNCVTISHKEAFDNVRSGMDAWLYEGGNDDVMTYTQLTLAPGFKRGWIPRVIEGGFPVVARE